MDKIEARQWRDDRGRFLPGNKASTAEHNPLSRSVYRVKEAMLSACTPEEMFTVTRRLLELCHAEDGRVALQAMELLFNRLLGKPKEEIQLDVNQGGSSPVNPSALTDAELEQVLGILDRANARQALPSLPLA
jgi:hypothetical protein